MANVWNDETKEYLESVHTPDFDGKPGCTINPDTSAVKNVPRKYWRILNGAMKEMTITQKKAVDDAEVSAQAEADKAALRESLINEKTRELAIAELKTEGKLDENGDPV